MAGCFIWLCVRETASNASGQLEEVTREVAEHFEDPHVASPSLSPIEVVRMQVESLRATRHDPSALRVCYGLAAPSNREQTGPFEKFAQMVAESPYDALGAAESWQVGGATLEGDFAAALVTTIAADGTPNAFRFVLEKQSIDPFEDCWMTVAVQFVRVSPEASVSSTPLQP